ncbi:MAG TPA: ABC transporter permease [Anaerolineaceae bacterium]|nr:ABC transporter permease [Anaerolineaceae bacterium]
MKSLLAALALLRVSLQDLAARWKLTLAMTLVVALSILIYLVVTVSQNEIGSLMTRVRPDTLVVQQNRAFGEIYGSRLSPEIGNQLKGLGIPSPIPAIHEIVGASIGEAILLRGVDLPTYLNSERPWIVAGRALQPGDPPRLALIGARLAGLKRLSPGGSISLRGRDFQVVGIFRLDTYLDNEAWISLQDAQALLNLGKDVSTYEIPDNGVLQEGQTLPGGLVVARKGESGKNFARQTLAIFTYLGLAARVMALAAAFTLTNVLWRLAYLRRRSLGILRSLGFGRSTVGLYLLGQAFSIVVSGFVAGILGFTILRILALSTLNVFGLSLSAPPGPSLAGSLAAWIALVAVVGVALPAFLISRSSLAGLLLSEP